MAKSIRSSNVKMSIRNSPRMTIMSVAAMVLLSWRLYWSWTPIEARDKAMNFQPPTFTVTTEKRIPRIVHQTYKTNKLPDHWRDTPDKWKAQPLEYKFWTDVDNRKLIQEDFPWFLETYDSYAHPISRADAARYFIIFKYGGLYADLDIVPKRDIESLFQWVDASGKEMIVAQTYNLGLTNALFGAIPSSKIMEEFVHSLPFYKGWWEHFVPPHFRVLFTAGPTRFWIFVKKYDILTLPPTGWGQCHQCRSQQGQCKVSEFSYFSTLPGGSWHKWDTRFVNAIMCFPQAFTWLILGALALVVEQVWRRRRWHHHHNHHPHEHVQLFTKEKPINIYPLARGGRGLFLYAITFLALCRL
jgi:mannosyltransferase OCH1-like enzyme